MAQEQTDLELGDFVKDKITGISGVIVAVTQWLYGCKRMTIQPREVKDNYPAATQSFDELQLDLIEKRVVTSPNTPAVAPAKKVATRSPGGPRPEPVMHSDISMR